MLNISSNNNQAPLELRAFTKEQVDVMPKANRLLRIWLIALLIIFMVFMFLPWTQNIQSDGKITTLLPQGRPQSIQATIAGQVEEWYVREGQTILAGDTILKLTEVKGEYLDPLLVDRTLARRDAKSGSARGYQEKVDALTNQIQTLEDQLVLKRQQQEQKIEQTKLKIQTQQANITNAEEQLDVAQIQVDRSQSLFEQGIDARSKLEEKQNKLAANRAKLTSERNKLQELEQELDILQLGLRNLNNETREKIAKARSDRASARSAFFTATGDVAKIENEAANYSARNNFYYVIAPQNSIISEAYVSGVGEIVKEGQTLVTIVPTDPALAVELFVRPMDLPLLQMGQEVRLQFDGWPAIVFGGWPGASFGTFTGRIVAIDNNTNKKGEYRILVAPRDNGDRDDDHWPKQLRPGSGARGIALLSDVPLWYELWRQLNGFPADYYIEEEGEKLKEPKSKAPVKKVIK
ncbi:biotin attachment protein [Lewinellaceae bacterium SD302]|nr:biotin attachment protein [Lewinellaceae bacterium SD302]